MLLIIFKVDGDSNYHVTLGRNDEETLEMFNEGQDNLHKTPPFVKKRLVTTVSPDLLQILEIAR